jgi:photosystem II stability/assembly factor-like uncharacterized protein
LLAAEAQTAFISYSREDSELALKLAEDLKAAGAAVWLDQLDIAPGQRWARAVEDALNACPRMLVILSPASVGSRHVEDEVAFALEEGKTVIPVVYRECKIPFRLRSFQHLDVRTDYTRGIENLVRVLAHTQSAVPEMPLSTLPDSLASESHKCSWNKQSSGSRRPLVSVSAASSKLVWAVGEGGIVLHTKDGGEGWRQQLSGTGNWLRSVAFATPQSGVAVGQGEILQTKDGGESWKKLSSKINGRLYSVCFATREQGWIVGENGIILKTSDGGETWELQISGIRTWLYSVRFSTPKIGWAVGEDGVILRTNDGGGVWKRQPSPTGAWLNSVSCCTPDSGWAVGADGIILHTNDGGETWLRQNSNTDARLTSVAFVTPQSGWAVGRGTILHTENGGRTWNNQPSHSMLRSVAFATSQAGWAVGEGGTILRWE